MGYILLAGTLLLTYIPAVILIAYTILPYAFITATFLSSFLVYTLSFIVSVLFWLVCSKLPTQVSYLIMLIFYITIVNVMKYIMFNSIRHQKNSFMIVGSNNAIHPAHSYHIGWAIGTGFGLCEATIFFGLNILTQFGGITTNSAIFPPILPVNNDYYTSKIIDGVDIAPFVTSMYKCGIFSPTHQPFPIIFSTSIMWLSVFICNIILTLISSIQLESFRKQSSTVTPRGRVHKNICAQLFTRLFNLFCHIGLYGTVFGVRSAGWCDAGLYIPVMWIGAMIIYLYIIKLIYHNNIPLVSIFFPCCQCSSDKFDRYNTKTASMNNNDNNTNNTNNNPNTTLQNTAARLTQPASAVINRIRNRNNNNIVGHVDGDDDEGSSMIVQNRNRSDDNQNVYHQFHDNDNNDTNSSINNLQAHMNNNNNNDNYEFNSYGRGDVNDVYSR